DFFSGSGTTAEAVMRANIEGNKYRYILIQLQENIDAMLNSSSANARRIAENAVSVLDDLQKPHTITELAKERIRRAAKKIAEEHPDAKFDSGFRVLKCDSSNMKDVYYNPDQYEPSLFSKLEDNIKEDRTP